MFFRFVLWNNRKKYNTSNKWQEKSSEKMNVFDIKHTMKLTEAEISSKINDWKTQSWYWFSKLGKIINRKIVNS